MADIQPFFDLMKAEGYIDDAMQLTDKGKEVLHKHWEKELTLTNKRTTIEEHKQIRRDPDGPES